MKVGDLILLADETFPRGQWPLGLITEVLTSRDGYVRTVRVKTSSSAATKAKRQRKGEYKVSSTIFCSQHQHVLFTSYVFWNWIQVNITNLKFELAWMDFFLG